MHFIVPWTEGIYVRCHKLLYAQLQEYGLLMSGIGLIHKLLYLVIFIAPALQNHCDCFDWNMHGYQSCNSGPPGV